LAFGRAWLIWVVVVGTTGSVAWADPPQRPAAPEPAQAAKSGPPDGPDTALERGLDQERARNWAGSIAVYRDAVERWHTGDNFIISPAALTVTDNDASKIYGAAIPALTYGYSGLVNGDTASVFSGGLSSTGTLGARVGPVRILLAGVVLMRLADRPAGDPLEVFAFWNFYWAAASKPWVMPINRHPRHRTPASPSHASCPDPSHRSRKESWLP
jgi:hypothetical protein